MAGRDHVEEVAGSDTWDRPSPSRMYDYFLGGAHNFPVDRQTAEQALSIYPDIALVARANRAFLRRAVRFLLAQGIDQFLDIGSGIPTAGNVHEIVHHYDASGRVVYVDSDPVAVEYSLALLRDEPSATAIQADVRRPEYILTHSAVQRLLNFHRPVAVLLAALLHFIPNDTEAYSVVRVLRDALPPGSYIVISHVTFDGVPRDPIAQVERLYSRTTNSAKTRSLAEMEPFFEGLELVKPGLVHAPLWRPENSGDLFLDQPARSVNFVAVGRKP